MRSLVVHAQECACVFCMSACLRVYLYMRACACLDMCVCLSVSVCVCLSVCMYVCMYVCTSALSVGTRSPPPPHQSSILSSFLLNFFELLIDSPNQFPQHTFSLRVSITVTPDLHQVDLNQNRFDQRHQVATFLSRGSSFFTKSIVSVVRSKLWIF